MRPTGIRWVDRTRNDVMLKNFENGLVDIARPVNSVVSGYCGIFIEAYHQAETCLLRLRFREALRSPACLLSSR